MPLRVAPISRRRIARRSQRCRTVAVSWATRRPRRTRKVPPPGIASMSVKNMHCGRSSADIFGCRPRTEKCSTTAISATSSTPTATGPGSARCRGFRAGRRSITFGEHAVFGTFGRPAEEALAVDRARWRELDRRSSASCTARCGIAGRTTRLPPSPEIVAQAAVKSQPLKQLQRLRVGPLSMWCWVTRQGSQRRRVDNRRRLRD